jgi:hypothetical protein
MIEVRIVACISSTAQRDVKEGNDWLDSADYGILISNQFVSSGGERFLRLELSATFCRR